MHGELLFFVHKNTLGIIDILKLPAMDPNGPPNAPPNVGAFFNYGDNILSFLITYSPTLTFSTL
jgi:hypothetical protein